MSMPQKHKVTTTMSESPKTSGLMVCGQFRVTSASQPENVPGVCRVLTLGPHKDQLECEFRQKSTPTESMLEAHQESAARGVPGLQLR